MEPSTSAEAAGKPPNVLPLMRPAPAAVNRSPSPSGRGPLSSVPPQILGLGHGFGPVPSLGASLTHRLFHPPKLERKHSSGDLHSRLKTRKILGVGETDNGDIHRSKISQLLGHNEHLYVKFPRGFWIWHLSVAVLVTIQAILAILLPYQYHHLLLQQPLDVTNTDAEIVTRLSGATLLGMAIFVWNMQGTNDKTQATTSMAAVIVQMFLQIIINLIHVWQLRVVVTSSMVGSLGLRVLVVLVCIFYHNAIGRSTTGLRKSSSYKDLSTTPDKKEAHSPSPSPSPCPSPNGRQEDKKVN